MFLVCSIGVAQNPRAESGLKKVIVQEVLQVNSYTYLNVLEDSVKKWLAVPNIEAKLQVLPTENGKIYISFKISNALEQHSYWPKKASIENPSSWGSIQF